MSFIRYPAFGSGSWKDPVADFGSLPSTDNNINDVRSTLDTQLIYLWNGTLWQAVTPATGLISIAGDANANQTLLTGTTGTDFAIVSPGTGSHTFNIPSASATARGLVTTGAQTLAGNKTFTGAISASNLSGTNTGNVTIGTANGLSLVSQALSMALADTSTIGALSNTDWNSFTNAAAQVAAATPTNTPNAIVSRDGGGAIAVESIDSNGFTSATLTPNTALIADNGQSIVSSSVTSTELGYVSGVTSSIQTQIDNLGTVLSFTSDAGAGGAASEAMVVTGILSTDTILAVSQSIPGANSLPSIGFNTLVDDSLTVVWAADPGAGAVVVVSVKR